MNNINIMDHINDNHINNDIHIHNHTIILMRIQQIDNENMNMNNINNICIYII